MSFPPVVWQNALLTFILTVLLGAVLGLIVYMPLLPALLLLLAVVGVGVLFDLVGVAVTAAKESPLHAMGADRVAGSSQAIWLVRRADRVANICNDVVGDLCATVSGAITTSLTVALALRYQVDRNLASILAIAFIAALTVGGKAYGKSYALRNRHTVMLTVGRILAWMGITGEVRRRSDKRNGNRKSQERGKK